MAQACPSCGAKNDAAAEVCFTCRAVLTRITLGSVIASRYEIRKLLGRGGMGTVYLAHDRALEENVALKILRGDLAESAHVARRFRSEIKLARKVTHPNVCRIHDYGEDGRIHYISMELIDGPDLKHVAGAGGGLPIEQAYDIVIQLAEGLDAIHRVGIVHRDIKTRNIMLDAAGVVKLMDFGIAKRVGLVDPGTTATGQIIGTPEYMSPEQARGERTDERSDIYALGIVVYEVFTGAVPFRSDTPAQVLLQQMNAPPPLDGREAARLPPPLVGVLERMLAKEPGQRFATATELVQQLRAARTESFPAGAPPASLAQLAAVFSPIGAIAGEDADLVPRAETESWVGPARGLHGMVRSGGGGPLAPRPAPPSTLSRPLGTRGARLGAVALLLSAGGAWLGSRLLSPGPTPPTASEVARSGSGTVPGRPAETAPAPIGTPTEAPAATLTATPSGRAEPRLAADRRRNRAGASGAGVAAPAKAPATPLPRSPSPAPTEPAAARAEAAVIARDPAADEPGVLQIGARPYADVMIDGKRVGTTPLKPLTLTPGTYTVVFTHPDYRPLERSVRIVGGQRSKVIVDLSVEGIRQ